MEPATRALSGAEDWRESFGALAHGVGATRGEGTALGRVGHIRRGAGNRRQPLVRIVAQVRDRSEQPLGIGVLWRGEEVAYRASFHDETAIHDHDAIRN